MLPIRRNWEGSGRPTRWFVFAYLLLLALPCMGFLPNFWSRVLTLSWDSHTHQYITERAILNVTLEVLRGTTKHPELHTDEGDFYSHSNWVEMGKRSIYLHLLQPEEPAIPVAKEDTPTCMECFSTTCRTNLLPALANRQDSFQLLTTGYFSNSPRKPKGKCSHGGMMDLSRYLSAKGGINKDSTSSLFSPHHYLHVEAAALATEATLTVLRDLKDTVGHRNFLKLFSVKQVPALVFVMDTTGSMFEEITAARLRALSIIQNRAHSSRQPGTFVLVPFHDPGVGPVYEVEDPNHFLEHMESLMALGGGDEPEMCLSAIQLALTHSPPLSEIFVFTDASPKDAHLFDAVKALAFEKQSKITFLLTEDPNYTRRRKRRRKRRSKEPLSPDRFSLYSSLSSSSGGLTIFTTNSDIQKVSTIVEDNTAVDKVTLLHAESDEEMMSVHSFRVDGSVKNVILRITGTLMECTLTSPLDQSQSLLRETGPLAELEHFEGLYRIRLLLPIEPGQWSLHTKSEEHLTFDVIADSSVDFLYYFATVSNETHPGLARVEGSPVAGGPAFLVLAVTGLASSKKVSFSHATLLGSEGESLLQVKLNKSSSSPFHALEELVGLVDSVPTVPFCIQLTGQDSAGNKLERVSTEMVQPTHVQIQVVSFPRLVPGHSTKVDFDILNHGPARPFDLTADDDCGYLQSRGPHRFHVEENGSFRGQVYLLTPSTAQAGATVTLTLTVHALNSPESNYAVAYLTVVPPDPDTSPPSCSATRAVADCSALCEESSWNVSLVVYDNGRSGLSDVQLQKGGGVLTLFHRPPSSEDGAGAGGGRRQRPAHRHQARLRAGDPPLNISEWALGLSQPLWVTYTSSCCHSQAEMLVWDTAGNMKRCHLTSGLRRRLTDRSTESSGAGRLTVPGPLFLLVGLLWATPMWRIFTEINQ
ncbi:von Willebrand factor A domain-containing protein 7 isoform 2-T2 [Menidia menidia]